MAKAFTGYDIIGDIHGRAEGLEALLQKMGYGKENGVYHYQDKSNPRQVIFLGDILDRGPGIREAVNIVRGMMEQGSAQMVMGNHEYHALCYCTPAPADSGKQFLREHTPRHNTTIQETLDQYANYPDEWEEVLAWMIKLPVFLEFDHFRVVHACWDHRLLAQYHSEFSDAVIDQSFLVKSANYRNFEGRFMSRLTQGAGLMLPDEVVMQGSHGYERRSFRAKFWVEEPVTFGDVEFQPDRLPEHVANYQLSDKQRQHIGYYGIEEKPLFVGHYWMSGTPRVLTQNIACLDYSAVKQGRIVGYRMDCESTLSDDKFVWVDGYNQ